MALAALLCLASCSDDDSGIQLTEDEVIDDIITGKQIVINILEKSKDRSLAKWMDSEDVCKALNLILQPTIKT